VLVSDVPVVVPDVLATDEAVDDDSDVVCDCDTEPLWDEPLVLDAIDELPPDAPHESDVATPVVTPAPAPDEAPPPKPRMPPVMLDPDDTESVLAIDAPVVDPVDHPDDDP
jgi:hypothetical protein